jgi:hypothetical protein
MREIGTAGTSPGWELDGGRSVENAAFDRALLACHAMLPLRLRAGTPSLIEDANGVEVARIDPERAGTLEGDKLATLILFAINYLGGFQVAEHTAPIPPVPAPPPTEANDG